MDLFFFYFFWFSFLSLSLSLSLFRAISAVTGKIIGVEIIRIGTVKEETTGEIIKWFLFKFFVPPVAEFHAVCLQFIK